MSHFPCPFCGSEPRYLPLKCGFYKEALICDTCNFSLPPIKWNTRVVVKPIAKKVEKKSGLTPEEVSVLYGMLC